ncbi:MAG: hypothetical protein Q8Q10_00625 [bacterium]|nr:hypothetical protein [bacterium]
MSIRKKKIAFFEKRILDFFHKAGREHLPWRKLRKTSSRGAGQITAYEVWVSEVMLQQTQVSRVIGYYERFLKRFPTVQKLARVSWEEFLPYYQGLGYYTRGRNMLETARRVMKEYGGKFPRDKKLLETLPGIGPYTAAAIMSFAYGDNHLAWDTNLKRVIGRFFFGGKQCVTDENFWEDKFHSPKRELNAALMDFGSALCVSRPKCSACALRSRCVYYREKGRGEMQDKRYPPTGEAGKIRDRREKNVDWREAEVILFLHENHKKYFSVDKRKFRPFTLSAGYNTRAGIKKYFQEKYHLILSVRPPHRRVVSGGKPILLVNAQILLGEPAFKVFPKKVRAEYDKRFGRLF